MREQEIEQLALAEARQQIKELIAELSHTKAQLVTREALLTAQELQLASARATAETDARDLRKSNDELVLSKAELALAQKELVLAAQLEETNKELEAFCYSVSHDLRAPLRAINGFSKALLEDFGSELPQEAVRYLTNIEESSVRMGTLIDDLLQFSRINRIHRNDVICDMDALVSAIWTEVTAPFPNRTFKFEKASLGKVTGDRSMLRQVWTNLLSNATKFTKRRGVSEIRINVERGENETIFSVVDNGVGFDMRFADKLFSPFHRLHKATEYEGTGVGLAIVQRIIHRHGGRVWASSTVNQGTTLSFSLPDSIRKFVTPSVQEPSNQ